MSQKCLCYMLLLLLITTLYQLSLTTKIPDALSRNFRNKLVYKQKVCCLLSPPSKLDDTNLSLLFYGPNLYRNEALL